MSNDFTVCTITIGVVSRTDNVILDLYNLATFIELDSIVTGVKYKFNNNVISRGSFLKSKKEQKCFPGQVTLECYFNEKRCSIKVFENASLSISGANNVDFYKLITNKLESVFLELKKRTFKINILKGLDGIRKDESGKVFSDSRVIGFKNEESGYTIYGKKTTFVKLPCEKRGYFLTLTGKSRELRSLDTGCVVGKTKIVLDKGSKRLYTNGGRTVVNYNTRQIVLDSVTVIGKVEWILKTKGVYESVESIESTENEYSCLVVSKDNIYENPITNCVINISFKLGKQINLNILFNTLKTSQYIVFYDLITDNAIKYIHNGKTVFMVFKSGSVLGCGIKCGIDRIGELVSSVKNVLAN